MICLSFLERNIVDISLWIRGEIKKRFKSCQVSEAYNY